MCFTNYLFIRLQFSNLSTYIPKKMVHPIASLVNPHAQLAAMEAKRAEEEYQASRENTGLSQRILSRSSSGVYNRDFSWVETDHYIETSLGQRQIFI